MSLPNNSRFKHLGDGLVTELVATGVSMFYDPTTQAARVHFQGKPFTRAGGKYHSVGDGNDVLEVDLTSIMTEIPCKPGDIDPVTGVALDNISVAGVLGIFKRFYDTKHNDRHAAILAAIAAAEEQARLDAEQALLDQAIADAEAAAGGANPSDT